jgi:hypothetical protein
MIHGYGIFSGVLTEEEIKILDRLVMGGKWESTKETRAKLGSVNWRTRLGRRFLLWLLRFDVVGRLVLDRMSRT